MATRTKGFFEQDHTSKRQKPSQWHRQSRPVLQEAPVNVPTVRPPIPATSEARSKLKAFQFASIDNSKPGDVGDNRENRSRLPDGGDRIIEEANEDGKDGNGAAGDTEVGLYPANKTPKLPSIPHANTFPSTPSGRLSLEDLIGNGDEPLRPLATVDESPEEQLGWNPHSSAFTPNRKRKRARSSSPSYPLTSSQSREKSMFSDEQAAQVEKTTPEADPVAALWQAYGRSKAEHGAAIPDFSHLIVQASPRAMETPIKSAGLRRWASTGNDWPSSKQKRRCVAHPTINQWQRQSVAESGGKSRVASMVKKIQESLETQRLEQAQTKSKLISSDGPSSSSPFPETTAGDINDVPAISPLHSRHRHAQTIPSKDLLQPHRTKPRPMELQAPRVHPEEPRGTPHPVQAERTMQESLISAPLHLQSKARLPAYKRPSITRAPSQSALPPLPPALPEAQMGDSDEFEDAFELTADDLDELMSDVPLKQRSLYDIPPNPDPPPTGTSLTRRANSTSSITLDFDDDDEFGCDDIDEATFAEAETTATQALRQSPPKADQPKLSISPASSRTMPSSTTGYNESQVLSPIRLQRYVVKQVVDGEYADPRGGFCTEKVLLAEDSRSSRSTTITLRGSWVATSVARETIVHLAYLKNSLQAHEGQSSPPGQVTVSDDKDSPFLVVHPDHMLSATTVADSFDCIRKAVLQDRIKATGDTNKAMVFGKILHAIFQQALSANKWDMQFLSDLVENTVHDHVEGLWELGMRDTNLAIEELQSKMAELSGWASVFIRPEPSEASLVDEQQGDKVPLSVSKLIAIEEHIWSPQFGLKGNIDATVESTVISRSESIARLLAPLEVKTGRTTQSAAHRAQTALYTLLLSDRYDTNVKAGILYYLESSSISRVAPPLVEIRQMIQQRNRLAAYIHSASNPVNQEHLTNSNLHSQDLEVSGLPNMLKNPFKCGKCYANQSCFTYHALAENGTARTAGMEDDNRKDHSLVWKEAVGQLMLSAKDESHAQMLRRWFSKWDRLLTFEESEQRRMRKELWTMTSDERENAGRCFGHLVLARDLTSTASSLPSAVVDGVQGGSGKINRFAYSFSRAPGSPSRSFTEGSQLTVGEPIVISSEKGQWALANGYVIAITKLEITVAVDRKLGTARQRLDSFSDETNQTFQGIMATDGTSDASADSSAEAIRYRLDKDEFSNGLALIRNNLVTLMSSHPMHSKLRGQIIFGIQPKFASCPDKVDLKPSQLGDMNDDQQKAVQKVMSAQDYALILGMPGTGKTTTIAHIIRALLADGQSILLTSFTHTAVDNILLKIRDIAPAGSILRLGVPAKINDQVKTFCQLAGTPRNTINELDQAYMGTQIVATTCMGTNHALFNRRSFDVCIVDEASQITLPTILGPLLHARKFVLVGDHYQLPPLVQNRAASEGGLDVSLFRQLSEEQPQAVAKLGLQYRMCADIMSLSNNLIYSGQLRCGNDAVANRTLQLHHADALNSYHTVHTSCLGPSSSHCWLSKASSPVHKVVFANTDAAGAAAHEILTSGGKNITNQFEAAATTHLVLALLARGLPASELGVITLYRSQLVLLRQLFVRAGVPSGVEIDSADRFQGRDKECIVLSMVRANPAGIVGDLLKDWRRVNVALTRARSKLVILGSRRTLRHNDLLRRMLDSVADRGWLIDLPEDIDGSHAFPSATSQAISSARGDNLDGDEGSKGGLREGEYEKKGQQSPRKNVSPAENVLRESLSAGNRALKPRASGQPKVIDGKASAPRQSKLRRAREQVAIEIFEDL